ncbi:acyl-CoA dehydrogenase family protein [Jatrophihabitans fulvus]
MTDEIDRTGHDTPAAGYDEREALRASVRAFLANHAPEADVRRVMATESGLDRALWRRMSDELGLPGLAVPEAYGGSGFGAGELQVVLEELGRALACVPFLSSAVLATTALLSSDDTAVCDDLLPAVADGSRVATLAALGDSGSYGGPDVFEVRASRSGEGHVLSGRRTFVPDAQAADLYLVTAVHDDGPALFAVDALAEGVRCTPLPTLDETRRQGSVELDRASARLIGAAGRAADVLARTVAVGSVALAAEHMGGARRALEMAVEYAKVREQFGRVIGSFQAVKHRCADMLLRVEAATSAVTAAAHALDTGAEDFAELAPLALGLASEAYLYAATENIELHGGIGFTWESAAHLYYKRAVAGTALLGSPTANRAAMMTAMGR